MEVPLPERVAPRRVLEADEAFLVTSLLTSVVQEGTGTRARVLGRPIAGKTGTSNRAKDAWFVGYSADIACAVWTGYDDGTPLGVGESGALSALPAFVDFMRAAHKDKAVAPFLAPPSIVRKKIDPETGLLAYEAQENSLEEVFLAGTEPTEVASADAGVDGGDEPDGGTPDAGGAVSEADAGATPQDPADAGASRFPTPTAPVNSQGEPPPF